MVKNLFKLFLYGLAVMVIFPIASISNNSTSNDIKIKNPLGTNGLKTASADVIPGDAGGGGDDGGGDCDDGDDDDGDC